MLKKAIGVFLLLLPPVAVLTVLFSIIGFFPTLFVVLLSLALAAVTELGANLVSE